ncbi:immune-related, lectin-like receptor 4 isoform X2 [Pempheris klunzingeri]|uniref:immune-related, lectin-like receptor 4 isoform X2 n=1 Tax=Pempheris klunzingeri TaxID=3127111 RepID=UPI00398100EC
MSKADVLYSDVKFTKTKGNTNGPSSPSAETTYSEVRILKTQPPSELSGSQQQLVSAGRPKVRLRWVAAAVLCTLLAAGAIALGLVSQLCLACEEGWEKHGGSCYYFSTNRSSWGDSREECRRPGGDLVKIDSEEEQSFLEMRLREQMREDEDKFWIGLTDSEEEGKWLWADGSLLDTSLTFWSTGEPDNWSGENRNGEDCVRMGEKAGAEGFKCWFDKSCQKPHRCICEKRAETGHFKCV